MKYFVLSDIHSFYTEMKKALKQAGYDKRNKNHTLIVCGDIFDRGNETLKVFNFLKSIPKSRCILVKGNHELLYNQLLEKKYPEGHDFQNGTVDTFCQIAAKSIGEENLCWCKRIAFSTITDDYEDDLLFKRWNMIKQAVKNDEITAWINSNQWKNYFELNNFIFVHSFIPVKLQKDKENEIIGHLRATGEPVTAKQYPSEAPTEWFTYKSDWRNSTEKEWQDASWGCPWEKYQVGLFNNEIKNNKVLVCGHWHTSDFFKYLDNNFEWRSLAPIYFSKNLIGLDGGCKFDFWTEVYSHPQNVLVIDELGQCFNKFNTLLSKTK